MLSKPLTDDFEDHTGRLLNETNVFQPTEIPNLGYWYSASAITPVADGTALASWPDLSGNGFTLTQGTAGNRPKYYSNVIGGKPVVRFDAATSNFMDSTCPADQKPFTVVAVLKRTAGGTTASTIVGSTLDGGASIDFFLASDQLRMNKENLVNIVATGGVVTPGSNILVAVTYDGLGTWATYLNGVTLKSDVAGSNPTFTAGTVVRVGRGGGISPFNGDMAELMRYNRVLNWDELQVLFSNLAATYSLTLTTRTATSTRRPKNRLRGTNIEPELIDYSPVGANLNHNGNFETDIAGVAANGGGVHTFTRDTTEHQFGVASLKTVIDGSVSGQGPGYNVGAAIPVTPGGTYTFSVYLKGSGTVALGVSEYTGGLVFITNQFQSAAAITGSWVRRTFTITVGGTTGFVVLRASTLIAQAITFYSDGVQLEAGSSATPYVDYFFNNPWDGFWTHWNWAGWIKPNIDLAKAAGLNCIRIIGSIGAITGYGLSQATYLVRLQQVIEYCRDNGMYYYATGGDMRDVSGATLPGDATTILVAIANLLKNYPDTVIGFDVIQEISTGYGTFTEATIVSWAGTWTSAIRAAAPNLALTYSDVGANGSPIAFADSARFSEWDSLLDYYDFHVYGTYDASAPNAFFMLSNRDIMIGEVGADRNSLSSPQITSQYNAVGKWMTSYPISGALQWSIKSLDGANRFGFYNSSGVVNTDVSVPFLAYPTNPITRSIGSIPGFSHYDLRSFHTVDLTVPRTMPDFKYWNAAHFDGTQVSVLTNPRSVIGKSVAARTMTDLDLLTEAKLDASKILDIELYTITGGNEGWPSGDANVIVGKDSALRYANSFKINLTGGVTKSVASTFRDNILADFPNDGSIYYIELALPGFPAQAAGSHLDLANSFIDFTSDVGYAAGQTDSIPFNASLNSLTAGGNLFFRINRDSLVNVTLSNITGIRFRLLSVGNMTFTAQAFRVYKSGDFTFPTVGVDTKRDTFRMEVPQTGTQAGEPSGDSGAIYFNGVRPKNITQVVKFNSGHIHATNDNEMQVFVRHDFTTTNDIRVKLNSNTTTTTLAVAEKTNGLTYTSISTITTGTLVAETDYYLVVELLDGQCRATIYKANGAFFSTQILASGWQTVTRITRGYVGYQLKPYYYDFSIDWIRNSHSEFGKVEFTNQLSIRPVIGASILPQTSPPIDLTEQSFVVSGDSTVSTDSIFGNPAPSTKIVRSGASFFGGIQTSDFLFVGDLKHAFISGSIFPQSLTYPFRVVLLDKFDVVSFIQTIPNLKPNQWNDFIVPINANLAPEAYKLVLQQIGSLPGTFWLQNFKMNHDTFAWSASANGGTNWVNFYNAVDDQYKGVNLKAYPGNQLKVKATALSDSARIEGYEIIPKYGYVGKPT